VKIQEGLNRVVGRRGEIYREEEGESQDFGRESDHKGGGQKPANSYRVERLRGLKKNGGGPLGPSGKEGGDQKVRFLLQEFGGVILTQSKEKKRPPRPAALCSKEVIEKGMSKTKNLLPDTTRKKESGMREGILQQPFKRITGGSSGEDNEEKKGLRVRGSQNRGCTEKKELKLQLLVKRAEPN